MSDLETRIRAAWQGCVAVSVTGFGEIELRELVDRTAAIAMRIAQQ